MKIIVPTSNDYVDLIPGFVERMNQFWPNQEICVLHYDVRPPDTADNVRYVSLGDQADYGRSWTDGLITFFRTFTDQYFCMMLEDYYLTRSPDYRGLKMLEDCVRAGVKKADLTNNTFKYGFDEIEIWGFDMIKAKENAKWKSSLQAAIWDTRFFNYYLFKSHAMTAWDFETENQYRMMGDKSNIIAIRNGVVWYENMMLRGKEKE